MMTEVVISLVLSRKLSRNILTGPRIESFCSHRLSCRVLCIYRFYTQKA